MKFELLRIAIPGAALAMIAAPAAAQRPPSLQQQVAILQQQLAASQASAQDLSQRLDTVERQLQQLINQEEENGHRVSVVESDLSKVKGDQDSRIGALEQKVATLAAPPPLPPAEQSSDASAPADHASSDHASAKLKSKPGKAKDEEALVVPKASVHSDNDSDSASAATDPGEDAYSQGYHLWADGNYADAIKSLKAFTAQYPNHRRVSWANNLIGRALLEQDEPRKAAEVLLANYRSDPGGGRAQDSLYYLGQSLMKLGQPGQACKAYGELESVYGAKVRSDLRAMLPEAKADAGCQ